MSELIPPHEIDHSPYNYKKEEPDLKNALKKVSDYNQRLEEKNKDLSNALQIMKESFTKYQKQTDQPTENTVWLACYTAILSSGSVNISKAAELTDNTVKYYWERFKSTDLKK